MERHHLLAIVFALGIGSPAWAGEPTIRIDDFEDLDLEAATGLSWMAIGDWLLGGASSGEVAVVRAAPQNGSRGALRLTGHLRKGKGTPFVSVWTGLRPDGLPRNLTGYRALRFRVRGTPGPYMAGLRRTEGKASANLVAPIAVTATWAAVEVPFDQLKQVLPSANPMAFAPTGIRWIGFTTSADTPPDFELDIDDVEIVPEPTPDEPGAWAVTKVKLTDARALDRLSFATVGRDARGDTVNARLPDARELQLAVDPAEGRVWFRFVLYDPPPAAYFGMNVALDVDGDPDNGGAWWGQNKAFHYDRLVTAYLAKGAGYWQGMVGVSDAAQIAEGRFSAVSKDVRVAVDPGRKTLAVGVPRSALGLPPGGRVRLIGTVGSNMTFNDDVPQEGALEVTIPDAGTSSSMSH